MVVLVIAIILIGFIIVRLWLPLIAIMVILVVWLKIEDYLFIM